MENSIKFITVAEFKSTIGATSLNVLKSSKTGKLFLATEDGTCYRVQQDIDNTLAMKVLIEDGDVDNACLVNVKNGAEEVFSL
jgi:hypothetical protein